MNWIATIPLLIGFTVFTAYWIMVWIRYGIQPSISDSYYNLSSKNKYMFSFTLMICGMCLSMAGSELMLSINDDRFPLMFLSGSFFSLVGVSPLFKQKSQHIPHIIGAVGGFASGVLALIIDYNEYMLSISIASVIVIFAVLKFKNYIWWIEIFGAYGIMGSLLIHQIF